MDEGLNTVRGQVLLQGVAFGAPYRKDVEYVCVGGRHLRQDDFRISDVGQIVGSDGFAPSVILVEVAELHVEYGGFDFIEPTVAAGVPENIFLC